jgi:hypothetical protein
MIKLMRLRWTGHVACMSVMRNSFKFFIGKPEGKRQAEDPDVDGKMTLE